MQPIVCFYVCIFLQLNIGISPTLRNIILTLRKEKR